MLRSSRRPFPFSLVATKTDFAFLWHMGENECRQSSFCPLLRTDDCRHPGGFQGRAEPAFGERPCLQGLVSYTFRHTADAKGGCGLWGSQLSCQPGRRIPQAAARGMLRPMKSGGRSDRSQIVLRTVRREVYNSLRPAAATTQPRFPHTVSRVGIKAAPC